MSRNINIGKVALKFCGLWDDITAYNAFDCVNNNNNSSFVALKDVPIGTPLTDEEYWLRQTNFDDVADAEAARVEEFETKIMQIDSDVESAEEFKNQAEQAVIDVGEIGDEKIEAVNTAGTTQVNAINAAGNAKVSEIQSAGAVLYSAQTLDDGQKTQSRTNIGAAAAVDVAENSASISELDTLKENKVTSIIISLPQTYNLVVGDTFELFYRGILRVYNPKCYHVNVTCTKGNAYKRKYVYTPVAGDVGTVVLTVSVINDTGRVVSTATTNLVISAKPTYTGKVVPADVGSHNLIVVGTIETNKMISPTTGVISSNQYTTSYCVTDFIGVTPAKKYAFREVMGAYSYAYYNASKVYISAGQYGTVLTIPANAAFIRLCFDGLNASLPSIVFAKGTAVFVRYIPNYAEFVAAFDDTLNVLCVGDSLTAAGVWVEECYRRLTATGGAPAADGYTKINFLGTVGTAPCKYEGYGGWAFANFLSSSSPFYVSGKINFSAYATSLSAASIDVVNVLLGWNMSSYTETQLKTATRDFINKVRASYPQSIINLIGIEVGDADGMGGDYGATWNWYDKLQFVMNLNKWHEEVASEFEKVYFLQVSGQFDSDNNMVTYTRAVNARNTATEPYGGNGVHPATSGYLQIADAAYRKMIHTIKTFM